MWMGSEERARQSCQKPEKFLTKPFHFTEEENKAMEMENNDLPKGTQLLSVWARMKY